MANTLINRVTNAAVHLDGRSLLGRCEEVSIPTIKNIMAEHKTLGMNGKFEMPAGIDKMEARFKWNSYYPDVLGKAYNPTKAVSVQVRSSVSTWASTGKVAEAPLVVHLQGTFKDAPTGAFKQHDNVELESLMNVTYIKVVQNGVELVEVDVLANIHKVNGVDILADYRANLGI
jgi:hypothetical protein